MEGNVWRPTHLTSKQMEERRLVAATLLRQGQLSQADIARHVGVSRAWSAPFGVGSDHAAGLTVCRAC
jgi:hypothetical protein